MPKITTQLFLLILSFTLIHSKSVLEVISCVKNQIGKTYVKGAEGPDNFDDSGLLYYCSDKQIPRSISEQFRGGKKGYEEVGNLVFFGKINEEPTHVGIYVGEGVMIHAPGPGQPISYFKFRYNPTYAVVGYREYFSEDNLKYGVDYYFYITKNEDLKNYNFKDAIDHFYKHGKYEGRSPTLYYDPQFYADNNPDLKNAFGYNWRELYKHFREHGISELRNSSPIYYADYYKKKYPDIKNLDGNSLFIHFIDIGIREGRQASPNFDVASYIVKNPDLVKTYGNDLKQYYYHYLLYGIKEGRPK